MKNIFYPVIIFCLLSLMSCTPKLQPVKIISIDGANTQDLFTGGDLNLNINMTNPNGVGFKMKQISLDVFVNDKIIVSANNKMKFRIKRKADFTIPLNVKTSGDISAYIKLGTDLFTDKKIKLGVKGIITAHKFIFNIKVPVDLTTKDFKF